MTEEEKAVELKEAELAAAKAKETEPTELEKQLAEKDAIISKLSTERENYKRGMLKAKGKIKDDTSTDDEEDIDTKVSRLVKEQLIDSQYAIAQAEKDELIKKALARNKELETALKNRTQIASTENGASSESKMSVKDNTLSADKIAKFKAMGWDDKKIELYKKNLKQVA